MCDKMLIQASGTFFLRVCNSQSDDLVPPILETERLLTVYQKVQAPDASRLLFGFKRASPLKRQELSERLALTGSGSVLESSDRHEIAKQKQSEELEL